MTEDASLARWSTRWAEHLPILSLDDQERLLAEADATITALQRAAGLSGKRALHAACPYATEDAELRIRADLPAALYHGLLQPGARYPAILRYSSASSKLQNEQAADQRGLAVRVLGSDGQRQDLLHTSSSEAHHARNAEAMLVSLRAAAAGMGPFGKLGALWTLAWGLGPSEALRIAKTLPTWADQGRSLASLSYFSRTPFRVGPYAIKTRLVPPEGVRPDAQELGADVAARRAAGDVVYRWEAHGFTTPEETPLDDHRIPWGSPWVPLGELVLPQRTAPESAEMAARVEAMSFGTHVRWDADSFQPLGDLNLIRAAYATSQRNSGRSP